MAVLVGGRGIVDACSDTIAQALAWTRGLDLKGNRATIGEGLIREIAGRLQFLVNVGLDYLSLNRPGPTLSGGEMQRIRLASQLGSELSGVLYVLDEPSIGLHSRDNRRLLSTLERLRDMGNSVLVVEHDAETMETADWIVDFGPGAGRLGGEIVCQGTAETIRAHPTSLTGLYLSGRREIEVPSSRRKGTGQSITIAGARENNLDDITVDLPLGTFICVTGVSGAGKSTLVNQILVPAAMRLLHRNSTAQPGEHDAIRGLEYIDQVIEIDHKPIGRTPRSNPATYVKVFDEIRSAFAGLPEARMYGYGKGRFSFNVSGGRCDACNGDGQKKIEMHFLADVYVRCEVCRGKRYNDATLKVKYRGHSIADVLGMTVDAALDLFTAVPKIHRILATLQDVGLGYIHLGQPSPTLSGGEAQRIKLSRELAKRATGHTLYVLDEPSTGLHFDDISKLLTVVNRLVDSGNTVVMIEHNLHIIKTADRILDLGPEGGAGGGEIVAQGSPEEVAEVAGSWTGLALRPVLGLE
jgi:excinuclease ABC subunit A